MYTKTNTFLAVLGLVVACILVSDFISTDSASAYTASITTSDSIMFDISPSGDGTSIHSESINVQSDCRAGYNLTIATPEGSSLYKYENNTQAGTASFTAVDGTSALNSDNNTNKWGYTLTSNPNSSTVFSPLSTTASVLKTPSQTASSEADINDTFDINYGAKVSDSVDPGTYQMANNGAIVYYLTMDTTCTQYTVAFNANGGTGTIDSQGIETGESVKLTSAESLTAPTGASYTDAGNNIISGDSDKLWVFWGWNTAIDGTGDWYKDKEEVEDLASVGSTITLYAQWKQATLADLTVGTPVTTEKVIDHNLMQDMKPEVCYNSIAYSTDTSSDAHNPYDASTNPNGYHTITLLDYRGKVTTGESPEQPESYTVSKLPDNLCWMTKDLNLGRESGGENNNGTITLTPDDSDVTGIFTLPVSPTTYTTGTTGYRTPQVLINHTVTSYTINSISYSPIIGYYSWAAATARYSSISTNGEVSTSICPKNWDLPNRIQFYNLRSKGSITSAAIAHAAPYNFVYGGYRNAANGYYGQTSNGYYWTSSNSNSNYGYWNYVYSSGIYDSSTLSGYKYYGAKVRCVASQGKVTINYDGNTNDGGSTANQENAEVAIAKAASNGYTKDGYWFSEWNTEPDGSGTSISANAPISSINPAPGGIITLYAQWLPQYTITYVNNCQTYASANSSCTQAVSERTGGQTIGLDANGDGSATLGGYNYSNWTLSGWKIKGWSTVPDNSNNTNPEYRISSTYDVSNQGAGSGITLYAHWVQAYMIQYDGNGADNPDGMGTTNVDTGIKTVRQLQVGEGDSVNLLVSNFKRAGYGFIGWSTDSEAWAHFTDNDSTNDPIIYGPIETISAPPHPAGDTNRITMYAVWVPAKQDGNNNPVYLQDFEYSGCNDLTSTTFDSTTGVISVNKNSIVALTDKRDNEVYAVARLADGNCWMIENLRLESAGTLGNNINDNSVTNESLSQGYGGTTGVYGNFVGLADSESEDNMTYNAPANSNSIYKSSANPPLDTYDPINGVLEDVGTADNPRFRIPRYNNSSATSSPSTPSNVISYADSLNPTAGTNYSFYYSYGNYYNWPAAMANTNRYTYGSTSERAGTSICPSGWHLPSANDKKKEFNILSKSYGGTGGEQNTSAKGGKIMSSRFRSFPNNYIYSGNASAAANINGKYGYYQSRSSSDTHAYYLEIGLEDLNPSLSTISESKAAGLSVRCLIDHFYPIQYDGNGADNPNGMGSLDVNGIKSVRQNVSEGYEVTLLASNFKREGYGFVGWSVDPSAWEHFIDDNSTNDSVIYGPMETIKAPAKPLLSEALTLYAVWVPVEKDGNDDPVYLQDFDTVECGKLTSASFDSATSAITTTKNGIKVLTDKRDNEAYAVARLADGNCWMIENLRLEAAGTMGNNMNDSSVTNEELSQGYGKYSGVGTDYGNFIGLANPETSNFSNSTTANSLYSKTASGNKIVIGSSDNPGYRFPRYSNVNTSSMVDSPVSVEDVTTSYTDGAYSKSNLYSYGNYYTWAAAMANTGNYTDSSSESIGTSICPSGWHLPSAGDTTKEYGILFQSYGGTGNNQGDSVIDVEMGERLRSFPNNYLFSGSFIDNSANRCSGYSCGFYWSRSAYDGTNSCNISISSSKPSPSERVYKNKYYGSSVRCLISGS